MSIISGRVLCLLALPAMVLAMTIAVASANVTVTVSDQNGTPIENVKAYLYTGAGAYAGRYAYTDATGAADLGDETTLDAGSYTIKAVYLNREVLGAAFDLPAAVDQQVTIETAAANVTVHYAGQAAGQVKVYLFSSTDAYLGQYRTTDTGGLAVFTLPVGGDYKVRADIMHGQYFCPVFQVSSGGTSVAVEAGGGQLSVLLQKDAANPMADIKLYLFNTSGAYLGENRTSDSSGQALFAVPDGQYRIRADYLGYQFWSQDVAVNADHALTFTIPHADIVFTLNGQYDIPEPIADTKLYLFTGAGSYVGINRTTDADGRIQLSLPDQEYKIRADYLNQQFWSQPFAFADTQMTIDLAQVDLTVVWNGMPLANVPVYLFTESGSYTGIQRTTDTNGMISYQLPQTTWQFRADYQTNQFWTDIVDPPPGQTTPLTLSTGGGVLNFSVSLLQGETAALAGIKCYVFNDQGSYTGINGTTDDQGKVDFELAAGTYQIRVDYLGHQFMSELYTLSADTSDVFQIPHQPVTLTVNGHFDAPVPLANVKVYLFSGTDAYLGQQLTTDASGQVIFNLPEKQYKARVDYMGHQYWSQVFATTTPTLDIPMARPAVSVTGANQYMAGTTVYVYNQDESYLGLSGETDDQGEVIFELPEGSYKFKTTYLGHTFWSDEVALSGGGTPYVPIAAGGGSFSLTVLKDAATPLANTKCYLFNAQGTQYLGQWASTDEYGQVAFDLVDGSFSFRLDHLGYPFFSPAYQLPDTLAATFTIDHQDIDVTVNGVLDSPQPIENVKVYLFSAGGAYLGQQQTTPADGVVTFSLPARDYKVRADYMGNPFWSAPFNNQPVTLDIPLGRAQITVQGVGEPLENVKVYAFTPTHSYLGLNAVTDANGQCHFVLPVQSYDFRADYQGGQFWSGSGALTQGTDTPIAIDTGGGIFSLTLQKDAYHPLAGLKTYVYTGTGAYIGTFGTSDADGRLFFALADGEYKFRADYAGYKFWSAVRTVPDMLEDTLTIAHRQKTIHVQAVNPGPSPIAGATAYVYTGAGSYIGITAVSDSAGRVLFDLPDGQNYKVKIRHEGVDHWSGILTEPNTVISISQDANPAPGAAASLTATVIDANQVDLSWTPPADTAGIIGYAVYRRGACDDTFVRLNATLSGAGDTGYSDTTVSGTGAVVYYIVAVNGQDLEGLPSPTAAADPGGSTAGTNSNAVANLSVAWNQDQAQLTWDAQTGLQYQIYYGSDPAALSPYRRVESPPFTDPHAQVDRTHYYQVASVMTRCDPSSGQPVELIGPLSSLMTLAAQIRPVASTGLPINGDGQYLISTGANTGTTIDGTYTGIDGPVTVTATLGNTTVTGSGADGQFSIDLPNAGNWQITISHPDGWPSTTIDTVWQIDSQAPSLNVDGPTQRSTTESQITITGQVTDTDSAVQGVSLTSDRYPGITFGATIGDLGSFTAQVPLQPGDNLLTVAAADIHNNSTDTQITVTQELTALPVITITSPANGATVTSQPISVTGTVRSTLAPEQIRLQLGDQVLFPQGSNNVYNFTFNNIALTTGSNQLTVSAQTPHGTTSAEVGVTLAADAPVTAPEKPQIEVYAPLPDTFLGSAPVVTGLVSGTAAITSVTVNDLPAVTTGLGGTHVSFQAALTVPVDQSVLEITINATDADSQSASLSYSVGIDADAPVIALDDAGLQSPPAVNPVTSSPYTLSGSVSDANLAGMSINDQAVNLNPAGNDTYTFSGELALIHGSDQLVTVAAWDHAGNRSSVERILSLSSNLSIEVINPRDGAELQGQGAQTDVSVTVRVAGAQGDDVFKAAVNGAAVQPMNRSGLVGNATFSVPTAQAEHSLTVVVENSAGTVLSSTTTRFSLTNLDDVPLAVESIKPANGAEGVEPNDFIALYFNKPVDPALLQIEVLETAHGKTYGAPAGGADITQLTRVELVEVSRDREPVPGGISLFPANRMAAFYPKRDLAYGGTVYVTATYDGQELARAVFNVRPLPTFIEGTVLDTLRQGLDSITVSLPALKLTARSDRDGGFGLGFKLPADRNIPGGRYQIIVNPGMQNHKFGIVEQWVTVTEGRLNSMAPVLLPSINPLLPFRRIVSGAAQNVLANGALVLDLSSAELGFADLRDQGDVHVQLLNYDEITHKFLPSLSPYWMFAIQPAGIRVTGKVGIQISTPTQNGTHAYMQTRGKYYVLLGLDPDAMMIVPVGLAEFDYDNRIMTSLAPVPLERLDYIGYAMAPAEAYPYIEQCALGEISFEQMIAEIESLR